MDCLQADPAKPLISLLKAEGLSAKLCLFILYAVAMANHDQETLEEQHICSQKQQSSTHSGSNAQASGTAQHASKHAHQSASQHNTAHAAKVGSLSTNGNEAQLPKQAHGGSSHTGSSTTSGQHSTAQDEQASSDSACAASAEAAVDSSQQQSNEASTEQQTPSDAQHQQAMPAQNSYSPAVATAKAELPEGLLSTEAGLRAIRQYLGSLGRHGPNTGALLTPMYGCAELPQAFCRSALHRENALHVPQTQELLSNPC